jgi:hypothetical protein
MGLYDTLVLLDDLEAAACPEGHGMRSVQTKDLDDPSMSTYLVRCGRLYLATPRHGEVDDDEASSWRIEGNAAVREHHFKLTEVRRERSVRVYGHCRECEPVLVRTDRATFLGDIVNEHALFVDLTLTFRRGEPIQVQRTSGTRAVLKTDLRSRGLHVLDDGEPLAIAHREVRRAHARSSRSDLGHRY